MNLTALEKRVWERLEQDPATPTTPEPEVARALNAGYFLLCLLTLYLEKTITITLSASKAFYGIRNMAPDYLRPLRLASGDPLARLRPTRLADLDAIDINWMITTTRPSPADGVDPPSRYVALGLNLLVIWQQPTEDVDAQFTYAYEPPPLVLGTDSPQVPEEYHEDLIKFALVWIRLKEGGQELQKVLPLLAEFLADAAKLSDFVRTRSKAGAYDSLPFELAKGFDASRLLKELKGANAKPSAG